MSSKIGINLNRYYSINFSLPKRGKNLIKFIILHYTGMKKETRAIEKLCNFKSKVSCHYFIKKNGKVLNLVPDLYEAWHAGKSKWGKFKSLNRYSIGIEIHNPGHQHGYKKFTSKQIFSLMKLLNYLKKKYNIRKENILGHSDISPNRKKDPGEKFPWAKLAKKKFCIWHRLNEKQLQTHRLVNIKNYEKKIFLENLRRIGYPNVDKIRLIKTKVALIKAFQRKFRQSIVNGKIDKECFLIAKNLTKL